MIRRINSPVKRAIVKCRAAIRPPQCWRQTEFCSTKFRGFLIVLWLNYYLALADVYLASHRIGECAEAQLGWGARSSN